MNLQNNLHNPVLLEETIRLLNIKPSGIYVDCTAGLGGHSRAILAQLDQAGTIICIDQDDTAITYLHKLFVNEPRVKIFHDNFINLKVILRNLAISKVDGILIDLGVSSPMFDDPKRGFSYHHDERIDMRMNQAQKLDAHFIVNQYDAKQLMDIFKHYGEIYNSRKVVNAILAYRKFHPIDSTNQLVEIIKNNVPVSKLHVKKHPARNYFQAIRIAVNNELNNLKKLMADAFSLLKAYGRIAAISFHSLEDRIIKQAFVKMSSSQIPREVPILHEDIQYRLITKQPITATTEEIKQNRRARSAKLRVIERQ
ncbi:MAG: 16S rRNA (cytosine(1402)-N(4))-methyltransferase RsmH [Mycoplasmataceae bacterium]|jgi:16S rRNA (cytosine1402-N4)-methyltransferase|nr:16S rRNA (cytosine(1402)-N(4))-methyltransferase RsmH [Mycoplasmataceae bacterium]